MSSQERESGYDLSPDKEIFRSYAERLDLVDAVKELVDNAIDNWTRVSERDDDVTIELECSESKTRIRDNTGGIDEEAISVVFKPPEQMEERARWSIGSYGEGAKKGIPRLGRHGEDLFDKAVVKSRKSDATNGYGFQIDRDWFEEEGDWWVNGQTFENIASGVTEIVVESQESVWREERVSGLKSELSKTYSKFLNGEAAGQTGTLTLKVNGEEVSSEEGWITGVDWSFTPVDRLYPRRYEGIDLDSKPVKMAVTVGLMRKEDSSISGTDIYCQDRLVIEADQGREGGYGTELTRFESRHERLKVIVELITDSDASDLPWNNLKDGIDPDLEVTEEIHSRLSEYVERYFEADISKVPTPALAEYGPESQYAANDGKIEQVNISELENTDKPTKLWRFRKLRRAAKYHVLKEIIIDHEEHDKDEYEILENEAEVPAYRSLVEDRATDADELDSVSPARGKEVVDEVKELKKTIGKVSYLPESAPEQIVEKGFLSLEEIRNASVYELRRGVDGVGHRLAEKIKNRVEPTTTKKDILQHLSSLPSKNVDRVDEEVAKLYKQLLQEFKRLPRKRKIKNVIDEEENFPLLAEDGSFYPAQDLFIPDNTEIYEAFEESETITFAEVPDPSRVGEEDNQKMFKLLQKLGAESVENECEIEAFGEGEIEDFDTTPLDRLERTWDEVISEASTDIDIPEVEWVEETGTRYILEDKEQKVYSSEDSAYYSSETGCAYDPETNCLYITSKFTVDWNGLADVLGKGLDASKKKIGTILEKGAPGLEERAIDKIRKRLSDEFDEVVDVHDRKHYQGYDVQGCDIFAIGDERQYIEVKSRRTEDTGIRLIGREPDLAEDEKDDYYLWIVVFDEPDEPPRFWRVSNPSNREYEPETAWRIRKSVWKEKGKQGILDE